MPEENKTRDHQLAMDRGVVRVCRFVILVASVISTITTGTGLTEFVFTGSYGMALAFSAVVQLSLVILSMRLSQPMRSDASAGPAGLLGWLRTRAPLLAAYLAALFVSSAFSYIYISNAVYGRIWPDLAGQIVRQEYRALVYDTQEYIRAEKENLARQINARTTQVYALVGQNLQADRDSSGVGNVSSAALAAKYHEDGWTKVDGSTLWNPDYDNHYLTLIRLAGEVEALQTAEASDQTELIGRVAAAMEALNAAIEQENGEISSLTAQMASINDQMRRMTSADSAAAKAQLGRQLTKYSGDLTKKELSKAAHTTIRSDLETLQSALNGYSGSGSVSAAAAVLALQNQMLQAEPDVSAMQDAVDRIISYIQSNENEKGALSSSEGFAQLLADLGDLNRLVADYAALTDVDGKVNDEVTKLQNAEADIAARTGQAAEGLAAGTAEYTDAAWQAESLYWKSLVHTLSAYVSSLPAHVTAADGDQAQTEANFRAQTADALDRLDYVYLSESEPLGRALNYMFALPAGYRTQMWISVLIALIIDLLPLGLNKCIVLVTEAARRRAWAANG